ncbi:SRPBCC family protein [Streptomyces sp. NPDC058464]|uniref:SRPBCC family protein n=1 Tax=unclassified Streptomyces TaxID=2593676 RepID=UPI003646F912
MAHQLRSEDLGFLERAPVRRTRTRDLHAPADAIFEQLAAHPEDWPRWFGPVSECSYEGAPPYGVGTVRHIRLYRLFRARETVLAWDPGKRFAYQVDETGTRGVTAMMEQWTLTPLANERTRVDWTIAVDCAPPVRLLLRASQGLMDKAFQDAMKQLEDVCRRP